MLKFKIDENLPVEAAALLIGAGHDVSTVPDERLGGKPDPQVALACKNEGRVLVTSDLHFADIRVYPPASYATIIVFRLARVDKHRLLTALKRLLPVLDQEPLTGRPWIVDGTSVRIHE
jgi:predicted nuclease of predicted toxin-antitoxin system